MAETKRYYWLRLKDDFFTSKRIKKLRRLAGGDTYTIIYLKMQLLALKSEGVLKYTGLESSFAEELALDIDEDEDNVAVTLQFLRSCGLIETSDEIDYFLPYVLENTGSEGSSAQRMRESRARLAVGECHNVTTMCAQRDGEKEIEKELEIETDTRVRENSKSKSNNKPFVPPSVDEVRAYCGERGNAVDADEFVDFYTSKGWLVGKVKMKDWKAAVRTWERNSRSNNSYTNSVKNRMNAVSSWYNGREVE